ncbi:MAG: LCP family protein [Firmicutes bacterium]|nr:LCP family protein [Bacillota bacterium]
MKGFVTVRKENNRRTQDFEGMKYSPELIRQLEDPEYAKKAEAYERNARRMNRKNKTDIQDEVISRGKKSKRKNKKPVWKKVLLTVFVLCVVLVAGISAVVWSLTDTFDRQKTNPDDFAISEQAAKDLKGYRNIAILGTDGRADESYDVSRTDAIIVLSFKKSNGQLKMISVMRDSYLKFDFYDEGLILDKVTHANVFGGPVNTCAALNRSLDLNIDEYVLFNWKAVSDAIDALGGIQINVKEEEMNDLNRWGPETADNVGGTYVEITEPGTQTLDGIQATTYCRIRKTSGGDSSRTDRYKKVVVATMKKAMTQPWKLKDLSENVFPNIRTNMTQMDILTLLPIAARMDMQPGISWPKEYYGGLLSDGISYVVPITLETEVQELHKKAFGQENYQLSEQAAAINEEIIYSTGIQ